MTERQIERIIHPEKKRGRKREKERERGRREKKERERKEDRLID